MSAAVARPTGLPAGALASASLAVATFLGGFVFHEPAPYELFLAVAIPLWLLGGLPIPRAIGPLVILLAVFIAGGVLATTQAGTIDDEPLYITISGFLALSACFFAAVVARDPDRFVPTIVNAWIAAALATAALGMAGYFGLAPGGMFTLYGRAAGGFEDPNVFGPFLVFPLAVLFHRALTRPLRRGWFSGAAALFLVLAILLSFSRAAWGLALFAPAIVAVLMFLTERKGAVRARYIVMAVAGCMLGAVALGAALSVDAVASLFAERARLLQEYDAGQLGRFARHLAGFNLMLDKPLGLGALEFGKLFGADEHNIWLKSLTTYGWIGFAAWLALVLWTLIAAFPLLFRTSRFQPILQAAYVVFLGHIIVGAVIDINHWRHLYVLLGILWGLIAADRALKQWRLAARIPSPHRGEEKGLGGSPLHASRRLRAAESAYRELIVPPARTIERAGPPSYSRR